jgi:hypothetical protein
MRIGAIEVIAAREQLQQRDVRQVRPVEAEAAKLLCRKRSADFYGTRRNIFRGRIPMSTATRSVMSFDPRNDLVRQRVTPRACHVPNLDVGPPLHLLDEPATTLRDRRNHALAAIEQTPRCIDERS